MVISCPFFLDKTRKTGTTTPKEERKEQAMAAGMIASQSGKQLASNRLCILFTATYLSLSQRFYLDFPQLIKYVNMQEHRENNNNNNSFSFQVLQDYLPYISVMVSLLFDSQHVVKLINCICQQILLICFVYKLYHIKLLLISNFMHTVHIIYGFAILSISYLV